MHKTCTKSILTNLPMKGTGYNKFLKNKNDYNGFKRTFKVTRVKGNG